MTHSTAPNDTILNDLTRIKMPRGFEQTSENRVINCADINLPVYNCHTLVLGSGAAGLRAAVELSRKDIDVLMVTSGVGMGTSACSGSDKQTLHTAATNNKGDDYTQLAHALGAGGAMDMDVAYVESVGSIPALAGLSYMGLPLPLDKYGAPLRYQTDHDEFGRATSCGPRTSRLMVKVLAEEALRLNVRTLTRSYGIKIVTLENNERVAGLIVVNNDRSHNEFGLAYVACENLVLATGGPGELYRDSVYPKKCHGSLGLALQAGIVASNLTESQFGISSGREKFPWNLSGTYMQVMPHIYSVDQKGTEHHFLADYFPTTASMCNSVFRKGYQWPFHAERTLNYESSLVDLAIYEQQKMGRHVYFDFLRNPLPVAAGDAFTISNCDTDVVAYLKNNQVSGSLPIDRLREMNPLAIELYRQNGTDLTKEPLRCGINNQHMNGGVDVDIWGRTNLEGCFAIGEVASTHGVTRPGGAALNAGQVFAIRVADYITAKQTDDSTVEDSLIKNSVVSLLAQAQHALSSETSVTHFQEVKNQIQNTMSEACGFVCEPEDVTKAVSFLSSLEEKFDNGLVSLDNADQLAEFWLWQQHATAAKTIAQSLAHYIQQDGGSRGARLVCSPEGENLPTAHKKDTNRWRFKSETESLKQQKQMVWLANSALKIQFQPIRQMPDLSNIFFEKDWAHFLTGAIYSDK